MKKHIKVFSFLLISLAFCAAAHAATGDGWKAVKTKTYSKSYPLSSSSTVSITNSYGNVNINHWSKNEVKVDVTITAKANDEGTAQSVLNGITINDEGGTNIRFVTKMNSGNNGGRKGRNISMQINYEVYLPTSTKLNINNTFGNTTIPDRKGVLELNQSYGNLTTGALDNAQKVTVEFGKLISSQLENTKATLKFSEVRINNLSGNFSGNLEFCSNPKIGISNSPGNINIVAKYSDLTLDLPPSLDVDFNIRTSFGGVTNKSNLKLADQEGKKSNGINYKSSNNNSNSKTKISIQSEFGKVVLQ